MAVIVGISPEFKGKTIEIEGDRLRIGRTEENDITIDNHSVSSSHASLTRQGDTYVLKDEGSTNGTRVNGRPIGEVALKDRDIIFFGAMEFMYADEVPGDIDAIVDRENAPAIEVASGPATTPVSFSNVSPFGARRKKSKGSLWYSIIVTVGLLALAGVAVLAFFLFFQT